MSIIRICSYNRVFDWCLTDVSLKNKLCKVVEFLPSNNRAIESNDVKNSFNGYNIEQEIKYPFMGTVYHSRCCFSVCHHHQSITAVEF